MTKVEPEVKESKDVQEARAKANAASKAERGLLNDGGGDTSSTTNQHNKVYDEPNSTEVPGRKGAEAR